MCVCSFPYFLWATRHCGSAAAPKTTKTLLGKKTKQAKQQAAEVYDAFNGGCWLLLLQQHNTWGRIHHFSRFTLLSKMLPFDATAFESPPPCTAQFNAGVVCMLEVWQYRTHNNSTITKATLFGLLISSSTCSRTTVVHTAWGILEVGRRRRCTAAFVPRCATLRCVPYRRPPHVPPSETRCAYVFIHV